MFLGDLHLVLLALNLSTLDAGILIMVQKVRMMMLSLHMADYFVSFLSLSLLFGFCSGTPLSCLKVYGWWWWVGGLQDFSVTLSSFLSSSSPLSRPFTSLKLSFKLSFKLPPKLTLVQQPAMSK